MKADLQQIQREADHAYGEQDVSAVDIRPLVAAILAVADRLDHLAAALEEVTKEPLHVHVVEP